MQRGGKVHCREEGKFIAERRESSLQRGWKVNCREEGKLVAERKLVTLHQHDHTTDCYHCHGDQFSCTEENLQPGRPAHTVCIDGDEQHCVGWYRIEEENNKKNCTDYE